MARWIPSLLLLAACSTEPAAPPAPPPMPPVAPVKPVAPVAVEPVEDPNKPADEVLVPSPAMVQKALADAGITAKVAELVKSGKVAAKADSADETAVRLGVILADLVLTAKEAPKAETLARLASAKEGFNALGAGQDVPKTIDDISGRLQNDAINSDDLVAELDELSRVLVPEVKYESGERAIPLIQAGGWLAGSHFVAGAIDQSGKDAAGKSEAATKLLKHPEVVTYFLGYVKAEGQDKAPTIVIQKLETSLEKLDEVAKKDAITGDDVKAVWSTTGDVLSML